MESYEKYGLTIKIEQDEDAESPREWDNFGQMVCFHSRYNLGDKHNYDNPQEFLTSLAEEYQENFNDYWDNTQYERICKSKWDSEERKEEEKTWKEKRDKALWKIIDKHYAMLPLYLYDHSGLTISTGPFSCPWDSGRVGYIIVGYIIVSKPYIRKEYRCKRITKKILKKVYALLESEVEEYDQYLRGDVYGYTIEDEEGDNLDSCWGFFGYDYCKEQAEEAALYQSDKLTEEKAKEFSLTSEPNMPA